MSVAWIEALKAVPRDSPIWPLTAPFSDTARTSGLAASSRAPAAGSFATTALMMCRSRVTLPPSFCTSGPAWARAVPGASWTMTSTRRCGLRSARRARPGVSEGSGAEMGAAAPEAGSSAPERMRTTGTAARIASSARPIIQRIRKTMFGAYGIGILRPPCRSMLGWRRSVNRPASGSSTRRGCAQRVPGRAFYADALLDRRGGQRRREIEALAEVAAHLAEHLELLAGLDALGDDLEPEGARELDDHPHERALLAPAR